MMRVVQPSLDLVPSLDERLNLEAMSRVDAFRSKLTALGYALTDGVLTDAFSRFEDVTRGETDPAEDAVFVGVAEAAARGDFWRL